MKNTYLLEIVLSIREIVKSPMRNGNTWLTKQYNQVCNVEFEAKSRSKLLLQVSLSAKGFRQKSRGHGHDASVFYKYGESSFKQISLSELVVNGCLGYIGFMIIHYKDPY